MEVVVCVCIVSEATLSHLNLCNLGVTVQYTLIRFIELILVLREILLSGY